MGRWWWWWWWLTLRDSSSLQSFIFSSKSYRMRGETKQTSWITKKYITYAKYTYVKITCLYVFYQISHPQTCKPWKSLPLIGQSESVNTRLLQQVFCQSLERLEQTLSLPPRNKNRTDWFESRHLETPPRFPLRCSAFHFQKEQSVLIQDCSTP